MFYKYEIRNNNGEDCLYLYLSLKYEFSNEFTDNYNLSKLSLDYININKINFKGKKIYYVVNGIVVKGLDLDTNKYSLSDIYNPDNFLINLKLDDNSLCELSLREYLLSILFNYYEIDIGDEVLKAICIIYNTYSYKSMKENNYIYANNSFYNYSFNNYIFLSIKQFFSN